MDTVFSNNSLKSLLGQVLDSDSDWRKYLLNNWSSIVGKLHIRMRLEKIERTTLIVGVYDPHWMHELFMLSRDIITSINEKLEKPYVTHIRFHLASQREKVAKEKTAHSKINQKINQSEYKKVLLSSKQRQALDKIKDAQLQGVLEKIFHIQVSVL